MVQWRDPQSASSASLVDVLDKVLDKGLVVAGDIRVSLASVELLTIKIRLILCSVDKAEEIGMDWWRHDSFLSSQAERENAALRERVKVLEQQVGQAEPLSGGAGKSAPAGGTQTRRRQTRNRSIEGDNNG